MDSLLCSTCLQMCEYVVKDVKVETEFEGRHYEYDGEEAWCKKCGHPIYNADVAHRNTVKLYSLHREFLETNK